MKNILKFAPALAALALITGCGADENGAENPDPTPTSTPEVTVGTIAVTYGFTGNEAPSKVRLVVIDAAVTGETCTTVAFAPTAGILADRPNLPINGSVNFTNVAEGNQYLVLALGEKTDGTRIAEACHDQVSVQGGETTQVSLALANVVGDMNGVYMVTQNVNLGLPANVQSALLAFQAMCGILNAPELCTIATDVTDIVTSMDVISQWTIDQQADGSFIGTVEWVNVEGVDVGSIDLLTGSFVGEVPGATAMSYKDFNTTIQVGNLVLFIVEDVLGYDLGVFGAPGAAFVTALAGNYVEPMVFTGTGTLKDANFDGINEQISGNLAGHLVVGSWEHDFAADYVANRQ